MPKGTGRKAVITPMQAKFVRNYVSGSPPIQALRDAGYNMKEKSARTYATRLLMRPHIREEFYRVLATMYPKLNEDVAKFVSKVFKDEKEEPLQVTCPNCKHEFTTAYKVPITKTSDQIRMFEALARVFGWNAPRTSTNVNIDMEQFFKLPDDEE